MCSYLGCLKWGFAPSYCHLILLKSHVQNQQTWNEVPHFRTSLPLGHKNVHHHKLGSTVALGHEVYEYDGPNASVGSGQFRQFRCCDSRQWTFGKMWFTLVYTYSDDPQMTIRLFTIFGVEITNGAFVECCFWNPMPGSNNSAHLFGDLRTLRIGGYSFSAKVSLQLAHLMLQW